jgi:hypothetical protein
MKKTLVGASLFGVFGLGILVGVGIRPAKADQKDDVHRMMIALEHMDRHIEKIADKIGR